MVDNASGDGSADMVRDDFPWVSLLALDENVGYGAAVNLVAERTATPWLVAARTRTWRPRRERWRGWSRPAAHGRTRGRSPRA